MPSIRIFGTSNADFVALHSVVEEIVEGVSARHELHRIEGFETANVRSLAMVANRDEIGLREDATGSWTLDEERWAIVADFIEPFTRPPPDSVTHFQWLCGRNASFGLDVSDISILLSHSASGPW